MHTARLFRQQGANPSNRRLHVIGGEDKLVVIPDVEELQSTTAIIARIRSHGRSGMKFIGLKPWWVTDMGWPDVSLGIHVCLAGRVDFHVLKWILSVGVVPVYQRSDGTRFASSNSFHNHKTTEFRTGQPPHNDAKSNNNRG